MTQILLSTPKMLQLDAFNKANVKIPFTFLIYDE